MRALDEAESTLLEHTLGAEEDVSEDQMQEVVDMILSMSVDELRMLPDPLIGMIIEAIEQDLFPEDIADKLIRKLNKL